MKSNFQRLVLFFVCFSGMVTAQTANPNFDSTLARRLNADEYGMKQYVLAILKTGPNKTADKALISEKFRGHLDNIDRLVKEKKMVVAGPLQKNELTYRGIFILQNVKDTAEARELLQTDPAIEAGLLETELFIWYGSAALPVYLETSDRIWKTAP